MSRFLFAITALAFGAMANAAYLRAAESPNDADINPYRKTYASIGYARNYPVSFSLDHLEPGPASPVFGYLYDLDADWLMEISAQYKVFHRLDETKDKSNVLAFWNFTHETHYSIRLNHPMYMWLGPKVQYLLPSVSAKLPLRRSEDYRSEVGLAASAAVARVVADKYLVTAYIDRWRGTGTQKFHAVEVGVTFAYGLR